MSIGIGIDTGGTYTDAVIYDYTQKKVLAKAKALTTKENLAIGIGKALDGLPAAQCKQATLIALSTTLATNACVENKGGRAKLILLGTTKKVLDCIDAKNLYGLQPQDVLCIDTKCSFDGTIVDHPDWDKLIQQERAWFADAHALSIAEVHALRNGAVCEKYAKEKLSAHFDVPIIAASELACEYNVMERGATALLNARLLPVIEQFMQAVSHALQQRGLSAPTLVVRSDGSLMLDALSRLRPVETILSGPASSVLGGRGLANSANCLIVDMGGTTTDISIVRDNAPAMTGGIRIGGWRTQIKGVFIDTFGLGGDSRIVLQEHRLALSARRVQPICAAAARWPQIKPALEALLKQKRTHTYPLFEFLYLVRQPNDLGCYDVQECALIARLQSGPLMLGDSELDIYTLKSDRLEDEGLVMRCGLTPTDIMHIKGDFSLHDAQASVLAARYFLQALARYQDCEQDLRALCDEVYDMVCQKLYENIVRILIANQHPAIFPNGVDEQFRRLIAQSWAERNAPSAKKKFFDVSFDTAASLIGIGAPTHIFLPQVAKALGTNCVIPPHAQVANAVGAIISDICAKVSVNIAPTYSAQGVTGYTVFSRSGNSVYESLDLAIEKASDIAVALVSLEAKKRGALGALCVATQIKTHQSFAKEGVSIDLGTTVVATASSSAQCL